MTSARWIPPSVVGTVRFDSHMFSNRWRLLRGDELLAELRRDPTRHTSHGALADGTILELAPEGWGTVVLTADDRPLARIDRRSWFGRRWEISGAGFGCDLTSDPLPRRWTFRIGGAEIGRLAGTMWSHNHLIIDADVAIPVHAMVLAWHVIARPWEAASSPRTLLPDRTPA